MIKLSNLTRIKSQKAVLGLVVCRTFNSFLIVIFLLPLFGYSTKIENSSILKDNRITQKFSVNGKVNDENGIPLPGASIVEIGTSNGVVTDFQGNFSLNVSSINTRISISYVGFETQEKIVDLNNLMIINLSPASEQLSEVVVIGYGISRRKDLTGAVDLVKAEDFNKGQTTSIQQLVQGKMAGVSVTTDGGAPGTGANILIRGVGSLNLTSNPLYVVDGLPLDVRESIDTESESGGVSHRGVRNPLNLINPNDIESITVLKDASATAIYGSRAANGVIVITTKSGAAGADKLSFTFNSKATSFIPTEFLDILNADEIKKIINTTGNPVLMNQLGNRNTDWQGVIYNTSFGTDNALSVNGNILGTPMRVSFGYTNQDGILQGDNFERLTASLSLSPKFLDNSLRMNLKGRLMNTKNRFANQAAIFESARFNPTLPVFDPNSPFGYTTYLNEDGTLQRPLTPSNPQALLDLVSNNSTVKRYVGSIKADYYLPFLKGMTATVNTGFDIVDSDGSKITDPSAPTTSEKFNGIQTVYNNGTTNLLFDAYLNYSGKLLKNNVNVTTGYSYQSFETEDAFMRSDSFLDDQNNVDPNATILAGFEDQFESTLLSYFGRLNYDINGKYLLTATLRADASSKLNPDDRWGYFPSLALAWNLSEEKFMKDGFFDALKLRIGYGEVGNVNGLQDYTFLTRYFQSSSNASYQIGDDFITTFRPEPINQNLRWEVGSTLNVGLDYSILKQRVSGSLNAYIKKTNDLIAESIVDPLTNFGNSIAANIGDMENKGIEFDINGVLISKSDFQLEMGFNFTVNNNEITKLKNPQEVGPISGTLGDRVQRHEVGHAPFSFYVYKQIYDKSGNPIEGAFEDLNGDGIINGEDRYFYKDPFAKAIMGLTINLNYKNFDVNLVSRANLGNYVYNNNAALGNFQDLISNGAVKNVNSSFLQTGFLNITTENLTSDYWIENASFLRLDNITLGYTFDKLFNNSELRLYATGANLFVITNYSGIDPEIFNGIDNNFYPRPKTVTLGLDFNF